VTDCARPVQVLTSLSERSNEHPGARTTPGLADRLDRVLLYPDRSNTWSLTFAGTASFRVSDRLAIGLAIRPWTAGLARDECSLTSSECLVIEDTKAIAVLPQVTFPIFRNSLLFGRLGVGPAYLSESEARGAVILVRYSWSPTFLAAVGSDLRVTHHVFVTPSIELMRSFLDDDALSTSSAWQIRLGLGLTVG
jgi:hypothetical protein